MNNPNDYLVGLDVGSHKVLCVIARPGDEPGLYRVLGYGLELSKGIRNGIVTDLEAVVSSVREAVGRARAAANIPMPERAWVAIGGKTLTSENCTGTAVVRGNEVKRADVDAAESNARAHSRQQGRQLIKMIPQGYSCGDVFTSSMPIGLTGNKVMAVYHAVYGSISNAENMKRCVQRSGLDLAGYEPHPWAAAGAVLTDADRYCGTVVFDIGAETTSITLCYENMIVLTDVRPYGAEFFTRDISTFFALSLEEAESLKLSAGHCTQEVLPTDTVQIKAEGEPRPRLYSKQLLVKTLRSRAEEFFTLYKRLLEKAGCLDKVHCVVLTGGGAQLRGLDEVAKEIFGVPVRIGRPIYLEDNSPLSKLPEASVAVGLIAAAAQGQAMRDTRGYRTFSFPSLSGKLTTILLGDY